MKHERKPGYWAVIPAKVRYDKELPPNAKLLYGEIQALANSEGYCWSSNEYFATLYGLSTRTVSSFVSKLAQKNYITVEILRDEKTNEILERRIWVDSPSKIPDPPPTGEAHTPMEENFHRGMENNFVTPIEENLQENNTSLEYIPPKVPQGDKRGKRMPRKAPNWKPERFAGFWDFYPRGENKQRAMDAWDKLQPNDELLDTIAKALVVLKASEDWKRGIGIPHASTFLNAARWTDAEKLLQRPETPPPDDPGPEGKGAYRL